MRENREENAKLSAQDLEVKKISIRFNFFGKVAKYIAWVMSVFIVMKGLEPILVPGAADEISAFSKVVSALPLGSALGYILFIIMVLFYRKERAGKERAVKEKARLQNLLEKDEPNRSSSKLTETGNTPKGD